MDIDALLIALDDEAVRLKVCAIVDERSSLGLSKGNDKQVSDDTSAEAIHSSTITLDSENEELKKSREELQDRLGKEIELNQNATDRIASLETQLLEMESELTRLRCENNDILTQNQVLTRECREQTEKLEYYRDNFFDDLKILESYNGLSEQTRTSLSGIFKDTSVKGLISCGIQEKNISNLWDYTKNEVVHGHNEDLDRLVNLFVLLFDRFKLAYPMFELQQPGVGESFDTQLHIKHNSSLNMSGKIKQVLLPGYFNNKTNKSIKSAVVLL
ncbi:hypothetical protein [Vibrio sp. CAU 1672]|uniref:hypothetical protein n=1 Tax=Vibrio sp. CAU 1672 TaxID=3032594 RepID=UPI0023DB3D2E|nr:hypothetical protein [Vibrio sp. CAU 1672]MDF2154511.1 hypothetical protein [Vibrio sp. CAU 1672]